LPRGAGRVAFSPDGTRVAAMINAEGQCRVWHADTGEEAGRVGPVGHELLAMTFHPDGRGLVLGGNSPEAALGGRDGGGRVASFRGQTDDVCDLAYSPDRARLVSAGYDRLLKLWDAATGQEMLTLKGHRAPVNSVAFSPGGDWIASGSDDGTVRLWEAGGPAR